MVHRTYAGLGPPDAAVREFDALALYIGQILDLQGECVAFDVDHAALGVALDGADTAAYHFTRRPRFYDALRGAHGAAGGGNHRLWDRGQAIAAFEQLAPYADRLRQLQLRCRPFGRDYLALDVARQSLETAAYHFTRIDAFYGAKADSTGPVRRPT